MPEPSRRVKLTDFNDIPDMAYVKAVTELEATRQAARQMNGTPESTWRPVNLGQLEERPPLRPTLGGVGIVYPGKRHVFSGPQESAKTLAAYAICIETVRTGGVAVVIDFEMGRWDARDRFRELGATPDELAGIYYVEPAEPATPQHIAALVAFEPLLVIVDAAAGAYDLQGLDDNKRQDVERFTRLYVRDFWLNGIATIVLDHVVKNVENRSSYAIGSERKVGGADVHLGFTTIVPINRGTKGVYKITTHKDRGGYLQRGTLANLELHSDPDTHQISWEFKEAEHGEEGEPWRPTILMGRVSEYLERQPEPVSHNNIITNTKGNDGKIETAIQHLVALGFAVEEPGVRGAKNVRSLKLYTPGTDLRPTSAPPPPGGGQTTSADLRLPLKGGREEAEVDRGGQTTSSSAKTGGSEIDVHDPAVQALLDGPSQDADIPF